MQLTASKVWIWGGCRPIRRLWFNLMVITWSEATELMAVRWGICHFLSLCMCGERLFQDRNHIHFLFCSVSREQVSLIHVNLSECRHCGSYVQECYSWHRGPFQRHECASKNIRSVCLYACPWQSPKADVSLSIHIYGCFGKIISCSI